MKTVSPSSSAYGLFLEQIQSAQIQSVRLSPRRIDYQLKSEYGGDRFYTTPQGKPEDLRQLLDRHAIPFTVTGANGAEVMGMIAALLSTGVLVGAFAWLARFSEAGSGIGGVMNAKKSGARVYKNGKSGITFADVAGIDEAKQELQEVVDFLKDGDKYRKIGAKIPKGILLVGPPGTGKTLLAKAIAGEADVPFISMSGSEFVELYVGVGAARVRDLFERAKRQSPCIIFIDELDAIGKTRSSNPQMGNDEREQTLNQLLTEMDGFDGNDGVILVAATNRPETLDPALKRPGRFDRQVLVDRPDKKGREMILRVHAQGVILGEDVDLDAIATQTPGFVGADLANLINEAALLAARHNRQAVLMEDVQEAMERVVAGLEKRSRILTPLERKTVAYHEIGHAIVGALMPGSSRVSKISIVPRGLGALGYTMQTPEEDRFLMMEDELRGQLATLLGGRAAEELVFGKVSTGASDDIQKATDLAIKSITQYGMSRDLGPISFQKQQSQFLAQSELSRTVSPQVTAEIDQQIKMLIHQAHTIAHEILQTNHQLLESMTQLLLKEEILEGSTLESMLANVVLPAKVYNWLETQSMEL